MTAVSAPPPQFLAAPWFQIGAIPLVLMLVGVLAKRLGRRDGDNAAPRNDCAVSTSVLLIVLGLAVVDVRNAQDASAIANDLGWLVGILFSVFLSIDHDRFRSWERNDQGLPTDRKRMLIGVILPDLLALALFASYQSQKLPL